MLLTHLLLQIIEQMKVCEWGSVKITNVFKIKSQKKLLLSQWISGISFSPFKKCWRLKYAPFVKHLCVIRMLWTHLRFYLLIVDLYLWYFLFLNYQTSRKKLREFIDFFLVNFKTFFLILTINTGVIWPTKNWGLIGSAV